MRLIRFTFTTLILLMLFAKHGHCQTDRIPGQIPQKWITIKHSVSPNRVLQYNGQSYSADFEDIYAKIWLPVVMHEKFKIAAGASYRTEQIEIEDLTNSEVNAISHWNLRAAGLDIRTISQLSEKHSLVVGANFSYSAAIRSVPLGSAPLNYTLSAVFMNRRSANKEVGFGLLHSGNMGSLPFLPIIVWNETFNKRNGIEMSLPYKLAWRHNLSERSILHFKAEAVRRSYFVDQTSHEQCRRLDVDLGISFTRLFNKWLGVEVFSGFRQNLSSEIPNNISLKTSSGIAVSTEIFILPDAIIKKLRGAKGKE
jgi:hypothetical protein